MNLYLRPKYDEVDEMLHEIMADQECAKDQATMFLQTMLQLKTMELLVSIDATLVTLKEQVKVLHPVLEE